MPASAELSSMLPMRLLQEGGESVGSWVGRRGAATPLCSAPSDDHVHKHVSSAGVTFHKTKPRYLHGETGTGGRGSHSSTSRQACLVTAAGGPDLGPGVGTPPSPHAMRPVPGSAFPWLEGASRPLPPGTLTASNTVPNFRSHIRSASFLLRQQACQQNEPLGPAFS